MNRGGKKIKMTPEELPGLLISVYCFIIVGIFLLYFGTSDLTSLRETKYLFFGPWQWYFYALFL